PALANLDECLIRSALGSRDPDIHYVWNPLWQMSEKEKAEIFKTKSDAARTIAGNGGLESPLMPIEALSDAFVAELVEDGTLSGLEGAIKKYGALADQEEDEAELAAALPDVRARQAANDAAPRTLYIRRDVINATEIRAWAKAQGFETVQDGLHVTIIHTRSP